MAANKLRGNLQVQRAPAHQWPVIWRVVAPACGGYDQDMVFLETESEEQARRRLHTLRCGDWPVRLERIQCGPLPAAALTTLGQIRQKNPQNAGTALRAIPGYWTGSEVRRG